MCFQVTLAAAFVEHRGSFLRSKALCSFASCGPTIGRGPSSELHVGLVFLHFFFFSLDIGRIFHQKHTTLIVRVYIFSEEFCSNSLISSLVCLVVYFSSAWENKTIQAFEMFCEFEKQCGLCGDSDMNGYPLNTMQHKCKSFQQNLGSTLAFGHIDHQLICRKPKVVVTLFCQKYRVADLLTQRVEMFKYNTSVPNYILAYNLLSVCMSVKSLILLF